MKLSERIRKYSGSAAEHGCDILMVPHGDICATWAAEVAALEADNEILRHEAEAAIAVLRIVLDGLRYKSGGPDV